MKKTSLINKQYPHKAKITRLTVSDNPFDDFEELTLLYEGPCRNYSEKDMTESVIMDISHRKTVLPVNYAGWNIPLQDGDMIEVTMGNIVESGKINDFEPDNFRCVITWNYNRV